MSSHYESVYNAALYPEAFNVAAPEPSVGREIWPRQPGVFIRQGAAREGVAGEAAAEARAPRELVAGQFGLVPRWVKSASDAKLRSTKLVNARADTVSTSSNFREAWLGGQRCIVPMTAFLEDDWRSGKAVPTRIARVDGKPMGVAGLWERWSGAEGEAIVSYTLLTVNANSHAPYTLDFSAGHALCSGQHETLETLMARADAALYRAKHAGRGQMVSADAPAA